jgi:hypothetical protein
VRELDNSSTHSTPEVGRWLERHKRVHFHFAPTSAWWMNMVEIWFSILTSQPVRPRRPGTYRRRSNTSLRATTNAPSPSLDQNRRPNPHQSRQTREKQWNLTWRWGLETSGRRGSSHGDGVWRRAAVGVLHMAMGSGDERPSGFSTWTESGSEDVVARRRGPRAVAVIAFGAALAAGVITNAGHRAPSTRLSTGISLQPVHVGPVSSADSI